MKNASKHTTSRRPRAPGRHTDSENYSQVMTMEEKNQERKRIFEMAEVFLESADRAYCCDDYALIETYLFMYRMLWEYAKDSLTPKDYLNFCRTQLSAWENLYM